MSDNDEGPVEILYDEPGWSTTVTIFCDCGADIDGTEVVLVDCPHNNGTKIEHCPHCGAQLGLMGGPYGPGETPPECDCWSH